MKLAIALCATLAAALQAPLQIHNHNDNPKLTVSKSLFTELEELARIVDIAYCVGTPAPGISKPFECPSRCGDFDSFELVTTWNTGILLSESCGYIALSHAPAAKRVIVAFRGTYSITNTIADLATIPQEYVPYPGAEGNKSGPTVPKCEDCLVHMGFHSSWKNTKDVILPDVQISMEENPGYELVLVGHSLGGAIAALAGLDLVGRGYNPTVTTFGEPRLGNQAFADYVDARFNLSRNGTNAADYEPSNFRRVTHVNDPIPLLPLEEWGYMPHGGEIFLNNSELPPELEDAYHCAGSHDPSCSAGTASSASHRWGIPTRFKIWQLFFAHRDYFWRLGLCVPEYWLWFDNKKVD
ncbi:alpha/beta-hydrolase [Microthyrium microscopicum]|uniref:Alpha/beta-hydrolase n=1 Tax=Microthyrium microscopicum TaxID=703497 RepID=A0A6A6UE29_9PEZI|nr:alpha/beta-hydrolase [Microthyrium microscopicum]